MRKILFRADGARDIGMGHLVRGMSLAEAVLDEDTEFVFVTKDLDGMPDLLRAKGHDVRPLDPNTEPEGIACAVASMEPSVVINDIRNAPVEYVSFLRDFGIPLVSFDDTGEAASLVDILIDANISDKTLYVLNGGPKRYYGARYILLNRSFAALHNLEKRIREKVHNVLVVMGGSDPADLTEHIIRSLDAISPEFAVTAVAGYGFSRPEILHEMAGQRGWLTVAEQPENLADLMFEADMAFSSGGISMHELSCLGTPSIVLCQAPHEVHNAGILAEQGIIESLGLGEHVSAEEIASCFRHIANNPDMRQFMSDLGKEFVDGKGLERITRIIDECVMQYSS